MQSQHQATTQVLNTNPLFDPSLSTIAKALYMALEKLTDAQGVLQCSHAYLAKILNMSRRSVIRHIALLESEQYVHVERNAVNSKIPNIYRIAKEPSSVSESHDDASSGVSESHHSESSAVPQSPQTAALMSHSHNEAARVVPHSPQSSSANAPVEGGNGAVASESHTEHVCLSVNTNPSQKASKTKQTTLWNPKALQDKHGNCILDNDPYTLDELPELEGLARSKVIQLVEQYGFSVVSAVIEHTKQQDNLINPPGFAIRVLQGRIEVDLTSEIIDVRCRHEMWLKYVIGELAAYID